MELYIYGAGGFSREVAWLAEQCSQANHKIEILGFVDDDESLQGTFINTYKVFSFDEAIEASREAWFSVAIGAPKVRQKLSDKIENAGRQLASLIHPRTERSKWLEYGIGTVICAGNILTTNIRLGKNVQINLDCTIGHDVVMDDFVTLAPGVHVSGCVQLRSRVYVGTGAVIVNGNPLAPLIIGEDAIIGAGAVVSKSLDGGLTYVGIPARALIK
jgi:sugar O-acyltransferase (sialic acid O-acetyltransferase NeuD family)